MTGRQDDYIKQWRKKNPNYFTENSAKNRQLDKEFGPRFRAGENMEGESYTQFKKRLVKEEKDKSMF